MFIHDTHIFEDTTYEVVLKAEQVATLNFLTSHRARFGGFPWPRIKDELEVWQEHCLKSGEIEERLSARGRRVRGWIDKLSIHRLHDEDARHIARARWLSELRMFQCWDLTDTGFRALEGPSRVQELWVRAPRLTDASIKTLATMSGLITIDLQGCDGLTREGLEHLLSIHPTLHAIWHSSGGTNPLLRPETTDMLDILPEFGEF